MTEEKKYEIDISTIENSAKELGLEGIDVLVLHPKTRSLLHRSGINLQDLSGYSESEIRGRHIGRSRRREILDSFKLLSRKPMSEHLEYLTEKAKPKPKKPVGSILRELAEPFFQNVGSKLEGDILMRDLEEWSKPEFRVYPPNNIKSSSFSSVYRIGNIIHHHHETITIHSFSIPSPEPLSITPNRAHLFMVPFMEQYSRAVRATLTGVFSFTQAAGYTKVENVRQEEFSKLHEALGINRAFFIAQGLRKPE